MEDFSQNEEQELLLNLDLKLKEAIEMVEKIMYSQSEKALMILKQVLKIDPEHCQALFMLGFILHHQNKNHEAIEVLMSLIDIEKERPEIWNLLGLCYSSLGMFEKAIEYIQKAVDLSAKPDFHLNNLADQYRCLKQYDKAIELLNSILESDPNQEQVYMNLGNIYSDIKQYDKAIECCKKAIKINPNLAPAYVNLGVYSGQLGDWKTCLSACEWRFLTYSQMDFYIREFGTERIWNGTDDLNGKRIIIYGEQGLGDVIQFSRYLKYLKQKGAYVILHCSECLKPLMARIEGVDEINTRDIVNGSGEPLPDYDYQAAIMSLPYLLNNFTLQGEPYISPRENNFKNDFEKEFGTNLRVGIVYAGSPAHPNDHKRSIHLKYFEKLKDIEGVNFLSLQLDNPMRQYGYLVHEINPSTSKRDTNNGKFVPTSLINYEEGVEDFKIIDCSKLIKNVDDTAVIVSNLDLLISCDTAVVHLGGALGIPTWVVVHEDNDWRWKQEGETTEWYNSVKIYRKKMGDQTWDNIFNTIKEDLHAFVLQNKR